MSRGGSASSLFGSEYQEISFFWKIWEENPPHYWNRENRSIYLSYPARSDQWGLFFNSPFIVFYFLSEFRKDNRGFFATCTRAQPCQCCGDLSDRMDTWVVSLHGLEACITSGTISCSRAGPANPQLLTGNVGGVVASCSLALHNGIYNGFVALKKWN